MEDMAGTQATPLHATLTIPTAAVGAGAKLRLSALMGMLQEVAAGHAEALGVGYETMLARRKGFVLSRLQLAFEGEWPRWGEELSLRTWPRGVERLFALREFIVRRADGSAFLRGSSAWAVVDVDRVHIVRPDAFLEGIVPHPEVALAPEAPERVRWNDDAQEVDIRTARPSDLDPNRHVNNTRYGDWISDAVAGHLGDDVPLAGLSINYLSEIRLGERVSISAMALETGHVHVQGAVHEQGGSARRCFTARVTSCAATKAFAP